MHISCQPAVVFVGHTPSFDVFGPFIAVKVIWIGNVLIGGDLIVGPIVIDVSTDLEKLVLVRGGLIAGGIFKVMPQLSVFNIDPDGTGPRFVGRLVRQLGEAVRDLEKRGGDFRHGFRVVEKGRKMIGWCVGSRAHNCQTSYRLTYLSAIELARVWELDGRRCCGGPRRKLMDLRIQLFNELALIGHFGDHLRQADIL